MGVGAPNLVFELGLAAVLPLLEDFSQLVQACVVKVQDLVLALPTGDDQLATGTGLVTVGARRECGEPPKLPKGPRMK